MGVSTSVVLSLGFTRIWLRAEHPRVLQLIASHYEMHQFVYGLMSPSPGKDRILYRTEVLPDGLGVPIPSILIQHSPKLIPSLDASGRRFSEIESKVADLAIRSGTFRFRLRANPVKSVPSNNRGVRGKRRGLSNDDERKSWLISRFAKNGLEVLSMDFVPEPFVEFERKGSRTTRKIAISGVLYNGIVRVRNPKDAAVVVENGIGRARGFGYGLLSLAPFR